MSARVVLGVSGASGAALAMACAQALRAAGAGVELVLSAMAERTLDHEVGPRALADLAALADRVHALADLGAPIASGSFPVAGMIVAPCSMRSLAAIAAGLDDNLLTRAASVQLKERRRLVLLAREAPRGLSALNLLPVTVTCVEGGLVQLALGQGAQHERMLAQVTPRSVKALELQPGTACHAIVKSVSVLPS